MGVKEKKSKQVNTSNQQQHQNGHFSPFKFAKLVDPDASWDKDQLGDVLHWIRQIVALLCGLIWGAIPLIGGIWIVIREVAELVSSSSRFHPYGISSISVKFLVISSAIIYGYYAMLLKVDEEDFGGHGALLQEGLFASITLFLLAWTLVYSLGHF
ncbi:uncharacterized protein LOC141707292 isoform X1 [Apium graveolens]|uniref:uncharacterized protein LOC141707292 isoform X1 n=1 Tax=Apium graveolens TaxID=4045 RepID=UPI003D7B4D02